jgi:Tfp pilus assembly protein PilE
MPNRSQKGYTFIELTISLAIVSFIIIATTLGSNLLKQAKLRSIISESRAYMDAIDLFEEYYKSLPGDMTNASDFWGTACDPTPSNCNGNGDGVIDYSGSSNDNEAHRAWQHLSLAKMIEGTFNGIDYGGMQVNPFLSPLSAYNNGIWWIAHNQRYAPPGTHPEGNWEGNFLQLGSYGGTYPASGNIISPMDAYSIDKKIDDGYPRNGLVLAKPANNPSGCFNDLSTDSPYNFNNTGNVCGLKFVFRKSAF